MSLLRNLASSRNMSEDDSEKEGMSWAFVYLSILLCIWFAAGFSAYRKDAKEKKRILKLAILQSIISRDSETSKQNDSQQSEDDSDRACHTGASLMENDELNTSRSQRAQLCKSKDKSVRLRPIGVNETLSRSLRMSIEGWDIKPAKDAQHSNSNRKYQPNSSSDRSSVREPDAESRLDGNTPALEVPGRSNVRRKTNTLLGSLKRDKIVPASISPNEKQSSERGNVGVHHHSIEDEFVKALEVLPFPVEDTMRVILTEALIRYDRENYKAMLKSCVGAPLKDRFKLAMKRDYHILNIIHRTASYNSRLSRLCLLMTSYLGQLTVCSLFLLKQSEGWERVYQKFIFLSISMVVMMTLKSLFSNFFGASKIERTDDLQTKIHHVKWAEIKVFIGYSILTLWFSVCFIAIYIAATGAETDSSQDLVVMFLESIGLNLMIMEPSRVVVKSLVVKFVLTSKNPFIQFLFGQLSLLPPLLFYGSTMIVSPEAVLNQPSS